MTMHKRKRLMKKFVRDNYGAVLHFSDDGIKWEKRTLTNYNVKYCDNLPEFSTGFSNYLFCLEFTIQTKSVPDGWVMPGESNE